jgi:hypothetical protein
LAFLLFVSLEVLVDQARTGTGGEAVFFGEFLGKDWPEREEMKAEPAILQQHG